jgi:hypothetical protein
VSNAVDFKLTASPGLSRLVIFFVKQVTVAVILLLGEFAAGPAATERLVARHIPGTYAPR